MTPLNGESTFQFVRYSFSILIFQIRSLILFPFAISISRFQKMLPLIIASLAAAASAFIPFVPAVPVERRYAYEGGGWGLMTSGNCPSGTTQMSDINLYICCPNGMTQEDGTGPGARVCCVDGGSCLTALQATPFCADSTWVSGMLPHRTQDTLTSAVSRTRLVRRIWTALVQPPMLLQLFQQTSSESPRPPD